MTAKRPVVRAGSFAELAPLRGLLREQERQRAEHALRLAAEEAARAAQREVFARAVGPVTRLPPSGRALHRATRPAPWPRQRELDEAAVMRAALSDEFDPLTLLETDEQLSYRRDGIGPGVMAKLRKGTWVVQGQVDLHGCTREQAREALVEFLQHAGKRGWRCVRVVHGKGLGSPGREPVLKAKVRSWLVQRQEVLAFTLARGPDGGAGALIVLLDSTPPRGGR